MPGRNLTDDELLKIHEAINDGYSLAKETCTEDEEESDCSEEQSLEYFNRYIAGDR